MNNVISNEYVIIGCKTGFDKLIQFNIQYHQNKSIEDVLNIIEGNLNVKSNLINQIFNDSFYLNKYISSFNKESWSEMLTEHNYFDEEDMDNDTMTINNNFIDVTDLIIFKDFFNLDVDKKIARIKMSNWKEEFINHLNIFIEDEKLYCTI